MPEAPVAATDQAFADFDADADPTAAAAGMRILMAAYSVTMPAVEPVRWRLAAE